MKFLWMLSEMRTPFTESLFSLITHLGEEAVAIAILCALYWCVDKAVTYRIGFVYFLSGILVQGLKITFRIERPWVLDPAFKAVEGAVSGAPGYSFPSGHTQSGTALYGTLGVNVKKTWLKVLCFAAALLVGFSRMFLGVHTPADVCTSFAVVMVMIALTELYFNKTDGNARGDLAVSALFAVCAAALAVYAAQLSGKGIIEYSVAASACKAAGAGLGFAIGYYIERQYIRFDPRAAKLPMQIVKYVIGIAVTLGLKSGLKPLLGTGFAGSAVRYMIVVLWVIALYPMLIKRFMEKKQ